MTDRERQEIRHRGKGRKPRMKKGKVGPRSGSPAGRPFCLHDDDEKQSSNVRTASWPSLQYPRESTAGGALESGGGETGGTGPGDRGARGPGDRGK